MSLKVGDLVVVDRNFSKSDGGAGMIVGVKDDKLRIKFDIGGREWVAREGISRKEKETESTVHKEELEQEFLLSSAVVPKIRSSNTKVRMLAWNIW
jgi:hypothetical protein